LHDDASIVRVDYGGPDAAGCWRRAYFDWRHCFKP